MDFQKLVQQRHSVRAYETRVVEPEKVDAVLAAARLAPSAGGLQAYEMVIIDDADAKRALADAALAQDFVATAPIILAFCADPARNEGKYGKRGATLYCIQDATIAAAYAQLAAAAFGLGSCWIGAFDEAAVARVLRAPARIRPVALIALGYGTGAAEHPPRRPIGDIARHGHF